MRAGESDSPRGGSDRRASDTFGARRAGSPRVDGDRTNSTHPIGAAAATTPRVTGREGQRLVLRLYLRVASVAKTTVMPMAHSTEIHNAEPGSVPL